MLGGAALGAVALGGLAIGWQAAGGGALGWDLAVSGGAWAHRTAHGGAAYATEFAVGGAAHANDELAKQTLASEPLVSGMEWFIENQSTVKPTYIVGVGVLVVLLTWATRRKKTPGPSVANVDST